MPTSRRNLLLALSAGVLLAGCAPGSGLEPVPPYDPAQYRLGTDDEVRVITYGQDQLTGDFRIDSAGRIDLPLLGDIRAAGLTTPELADQIRAGLRQKGILRDADVAVQVTAYRLVSIIGEVAHPGQYAYQPGMTLLSAVAAAGGFTYRSWQKSAYVVRQEGGHVVTGSLLPQDFVKPGDVIKIYERHF
ncbi:polysaccharide biosynthesis/export family protein [Acidomonas methanolica]|uniref:Polysaccharide export protein AceH/exoF n=1 Tax=Acidomonas methanolica NBRC 104435 TaxID=1231351 RepID=A0A023D8U4_ACIMT|nr:polysaccharide biosynthesis/export family protein [Acidomonas methanolica]MBU2655411.1 polysaccharide export protein [Acidomonas methanolica]TCS23483.1 polysaccharide export outer membrane protein [Acidomonas methanolica]GAJ30544.1 polysaccharide export protein AceH/exoF [Acidomonas methanolica NBRC 104435]GEL00285.1 polysaccharide export protein [Acidomonas methanolica NBRC 104435]